MFGTLLFVCRDTVWGPLCCGWPRVITFLCIARISHTLVGGAHYGHCPSTIALEFRKQGASIGLIDRSSFFTIFAWKLALSAVIFSKIFCNLSPLLIFLRSKAAKLDSNGQRFKNVTQKLSRWFFIQLENLCWLSKHINIKKIFVDCQNISISRCYRYSEHSTDNGCCRACSLDPGIVCSIRSFPSGRDKCRVLWVGGGKQDMEMSPKVKCSPCLKLYMSSMWQDPTCSTNTPRMSRMSLDPDMSSRTPGKWHPICHTCQTKPCHTRPMSNAEITARLLSPHCQVFVAGLPRMGTLPPHLLYCQESK